MRSLGGMVKTALVWIGAALVGAAVFLGAGTVTGDADMHAVLLLAMIAVPAVPAAIYLALNRWEDRTDPK